MSDEEITFDGLSIGSEVVTESSDFHSSLVSEEEPLTPGPSRVVENTAFQNLLARMQERIDAENRLNPYCFQDDPQWGPNDERPLPIADVEGRLENNGWCKCSHCRVMPSVEESICCHEFAAINTYRESYERVSLHPQFLLMVVDDYHLQHYLSMSDRVTTNIMRRDGNRNYRWIAYRSFSALIYGYLGDGNRVPIPSCVVNAIRVKYPSPDGQYIGFQWFADYNTRDAPSGLNF
ncbi:uncharacterized protein [Dendropsophus ebraccatus]|uniref:uncharacterized protein n=1 Tax=Dendropsophus ebraccatus TaxID=150705 RepID=UPI0038316F51